MAGNGDKVRMLYAFEGIQENNELILNEGDIVTITDADVGEGWLEGQSANGTVGLFPSGYTEVVNEAELDNAYASPDVNQQQDLLGSYSSQSQDNAGYQADDFADDDWEASWGTEPASTAATAAVSQSQTPSPLKSAPTKAEGDSPKKPAKSGLFGGLFSSFSTTPSEAFVSGESEKVDTSGKPKIILTITDGLPMWQYSDKQFACQISDPQKASKFSGLKSYITYSITPSDTGKTVSRRYKHFDWLLEQLTRKFSVIIAVPPLPDKQITGRYEEDFIGGRMQQLQMWIERMCMHPIISESEVFQHFLRSKDSEKAWKDGKRKAEGDAAVGGAFCTTVTPLEQYRIELPEAEKTLQHNVQFTKSVDDALKDMIGHGTDYSRKCDGPLTREYQRTGQCFGAIATAFAIDPRESSKPLTEAIKHTGATYEKIGEMFHNQSKIDWIPLLDGLIEYKGIMSCFPNILGNNKSGIDKQREIQKLQLEGKCTTDDVEAAKLRAETLSYAVQAEVNHMQHYRVGDFTEYMKRFIQQQVIFYQNIVTELQENARLYEDLH